MDSILLTLKILGIFIGGWFLLWIMFLAVMSLKAAKDSGKLTGVAYGFGMVVLIIGYLVDFLINMAPATVLFLEPPFELTVTARCGSYLTDPGFRGGIARWLCRNLLDPFQIGGHCHKQ